jgi:hypothetical protein
VELGRLDERSFPDVSADITVVIFRMNKSGIYLGGMGWKQIWQLEGFEQ